MPPFQFELSGYSWGSIYLDFNECFGREVEISLLIPGYYGDGIESWHTSRTAFCNSRHAAPFQMDIVNQEPNPVIYHLLGAYKHLRGQETDLWHQFVEYERTEISPPLSFKISGSGNTPGPYYIERITAHAQVEIAPHIICGTSESITREIENIIRRWLPTGDSTIKELEDLRRLVLNAEKNGTEAELLENLRRRLRVLEEK